MNIPQRFAFRTLFGGAILTYAQTLFAGRQADPIASEAQAMTDAIGRCAGVTACQNEVFEYFGVLRTSFGVLGSLGDINAIYSQLLQVLGAKDFKTEADKLNDVFYGREVCDRLQLDADKPLNHCGALF